MKPIKIELTYGAATYVLSLVQADGERMRHLLEHGRSRGERNLTYPYINFGNEVSAQIVVAIGEYLPDAND